MLLMKQSFNNLVILIHVSAGEIDIFNLSPLSDCTGEANINYKPIWVFMCPFFARLKNNYNKNLSDLKSVKNEHYSWPHLKKG